MSTVTLTQADNGKSLEVNPGDIIAVSLEENPTTGYRWAMDSLDQQTVTLVSSDYNPAGGGVGSGGTRTFRLRAVERGLTQARLKLWREWEGDSSIIQRFEATIRVH